MTLTRITGDNIKPGSITANSLAEGISLGGGGAGGVTIDEIIITDENFANTQNITLLSNSLNYFKLYGSGFEPNANVFLSNTIILNYKSESNTINENEVTVTVNNLNSSNYNLILVNTNGSSSIKPKSIIVTD